MPLKSGEMSAKFSEARSKPAPEKEVIKIKDNTPYAPMPEKKKPPEPRIVRAVPQPQQQQVRQQKGQPRNVVLFSFFGSVVLLTVYKLEKGQFPSWHMIEGGLIAYMMLAITSEVSPDLANAGAILVLLAVALKVGPDVFKGLNSMLVSNQPAAKKTVNTKYSQPVTPNTVQSVNTNTPTWDNPTGT